MKDISVLVVPEKESFSKAVSHNNVVWISKGLGKPDLKGRNAKYLAPYWLKNNLGADRIYHILGLKEDEDCYVIELGNSFKLSKNWCDIAQSRRYEYWKLKDFHFVEVAPGLLTPFNL